MRNNKVKIVVDTNAFVNSMIFPDEYVNDSNTLDSLLELMGNNKIELAFSQDTIGELLYIIKNKITHYIKKDKQIEYMCKIASLFFYSYSVNTSNTIAPKCKDERDNMFLQCAIESRATYLISNDLKSGMHLIENLKYEVINCQKFVELYDKNKLKNISIDNNEVATDSTSPK